MRYSISSSLAAAALVAAVLSACSDVPTAPSTTSAVTGPSLSMSTLQTSGTPATITTRLNSGLCMDVLGGGAVAGARVGIWPCNGQANEQFAWQSDGSIHYGALCVDASGGTGKNGDAIVVWTCNGGANQRWTGTTDGQIQGINGRCIDLPGGNTSSGTGLVLWDCNGGTNQRWDDHAVGGQVVAGVAIYPGTSIQTVVNANPAGTTFILKAGTHTNQSVVPKSGDVFYGESGAVLDGGNSVQYAFATGNSSYPSNVRIHGLKITRYAPPQQQGAVSAGGAAKTQNSLGWTIDSCEIANNSVYGIRMGNGTQIIGNYIHDNAQLGVGGVGDNDLVQGNEIARNGSTTYNVTYEVGGAKFTNTTNLVVRSNYSHNNYGPGFWTDENNISTLYENNRVEDNSTVGIFHEISYAAVIRNNQVARNGFTGSGWLYGGGITVSASPNVEVYGNTVTNNFNGITGIMQNRGSGAYGLHSLDNLYVHDNVITMASGRTGVGQDIGDTTYFTSRGNRYVNNTYYLNGRTDDPFDWMNGTRKAPQWRAFGEDVTGTFNN